METVHVREAGGGARKAWHAKVTGRNLAEPRSWVKALGEERGSWGPGAHLGDRVKLMRVSLVATSGV